MAAGDASGHLRAVGGVCIITNNRPVNSFLTPTLDFFGQKFYLWGMALDLKKAVQSAGGYQAVAQEMGLTKQMIWSWVNVLKQVPAKRAMAFAEAIKQPRHLIRPDIYPADRETV